MPNRVVSLQHPGTGSPFPGVWFEKQIAMKEIFPIAVSRCRARPCRRRCASRTISSKRRCASTITTAATAARKSVFLRRPEGRTLLGRLAHVSAPRYDRLREPVFPHRRPRFRTGDLFARLLYALQRVAEHGRGRQRAPFLSRVGRIPLSQAPVPHRDLRPQCRGALRKAVQPEYRPRILLRGAVHAPATRLSRWHITATPHIVSTSCCCPRRVWRRGAGEIQKAACRELAREFFSYWPAREYASRFNIRAVWAPSADSGVTIPGERVRAQHGLRGLFLYARLGALPDGRRLPAPARHRGACPL